MNVIHVNECDTCRNKLKCKQKESYLKTAQIIQNEIAQIRNKNNCSVLSFSLYCKEWKYKYNTK
jgi:hypothetical protein